MLKMNEMEHLYVTASTLLVIWIDGQSEEIRAKLTVGVSSE